MTASPPPAPPMNHVLVDFENVHQVDLALIGARSVIFTLMVGAKQTKLDSDLVEQLMTHATSVQLVKLNSSGRNALDFALAYYLGRAVLADPTAHFHIISRDGGFDSLIEHLRVRHIQVHRHENCADLPFTWPGKKTPVSQPVAGKKTVPAKVAKTSTDKKETEGVEAWVKRVSDNFIAHPKALPKKRKSLRAMIANLINKSEDGPEVQAVIAKFEELGKLKFDEKDVPDLSAVTKNPK